MHVEVRHRLTRIVSLIDHQSVTVGQPLVLRDDLGGVEQMLMVARVRKRSDAGNGVSGNDQHVDRRLGINVADCKAMRVLINDFGRNFAGQNALEQRGHQLLY